MLRQFTAHMNILNMIKVMSSIYFAGIWSWRVRAAGDQDKAERIDLAIEMAWQNRNRGLPDNKLTIWQKRIKVMVYLLWVLNMTDTVFSILAKWQQVDSKLVVFFQLNVLYIFIVSAEAGHK